MIHFGLKNVEITYQMLVYKMLANLIDKTMKIYVDDMFIKSLKAVDHVAQMNESSQILWRYRMRLNSLNVSLVLPPTGSWGTWSTKETYKQNLKNSILDWDEVPQKPKEVQSLMGHMSTLNRFISKATEKCLSFLKVVRGKEILMNGRVWRGPPKVKKAPRAGPLISKP